MMLDVMKANGADAFVSKLAAAVRGSTDTTFYILAVYFGSVGVTKTRYAAGYALPLRTSQELSRQWRWPIASSDCSFCLSYPDRLG